MLTLKKLRMVNYISYKDTTIDFDKAFSKSNILLMYGKNYDDQAFASDNGAGKSIIYDAVVYTLFDKTTKNSNKDQLIGKFGESMMTEIELTNGVHDYTITRHRKHPEHGNAVLFAKNGKLKNIKSTQTDMTTWILSKLGLSYKRVLNTSIFESNDVRSKFIYLGDKDRKELLSQLKGLDIFSKCVDIAKSKVEEGKQGINELNHELEKHLILTSRMKSEIKEQKRQSKIFAKDKLETIAKLIKELKEIKEKIKSLESDRKESIKSQKNLIKNLRSKIKPVKKLNKLKDECDKINSQLMICKANTIHLQNNINSLQDRINNLQRNRKNTGETCDECGSLISNDNINKLISKLKTETISLTNDLKKRNEDYRQLCDDKNIIIQKLKDIEVIVAENKRIENQISSIEYGIEKLKSLADTKALMYKQDFSKLQKRIDEIKNAKNVHIERSNTVRKEKKEIEKTIDELKEEVKSLQKKLRYNLAWHEGYGKEAIQAFALKSTVAELNKHMRDVSNVLTDGIIDVKLLTEKTQGNQKIRNIFELDISDAHKENLPFKEWSKGQKKRIEIISSFALMNLESNLISEIFLDELFDGIDKVGIIKIRDLLDEESNNNKRFIVISHSEHIKDLFPNRAMIKLKDGISTFHLEG